MFFLIALSIVDHQIIEQPTQIKQVELYRNTLTVIDYFTGFGAVISHNLEIHNQLCWPEKNTNHFNWLNNIPNNNLVIIFKMADSLASLFTFRYSLGELIAILVIDNFNHIVLNNYAEFIHIQNYQIKIRKQYLLLLNQNPISLEFVDDCIIIIMPHLTGLLPFNSRSFPDNIIQVQYQLVGVLAIAKYDKCLYVALQNDGLYIFKVHNLDFHLLHRLEVKFITDVIVYKELSKIHILILDYTQGMMIFHYSDDQIRFDTKHGIIPIAGHIFKKYRNTILVIQQANEQIFYIHDVHLTQNNYYLLNRFQMKGKARDIQITQHYAIILGNNGHFVIFHSISQFFYPSNQLFTTQSLILPGLRKLIMTDDDILVGITKYKYFSYKTNLKPNKIQCFAEQLPESQFKMSYHLKSTQCPGKIDQENDLQMCQIDQEYLVVCKQPIITSRSQFYLIILSIIGCIMLAGIFCFCNYRKLRNAQEQIKFEELRVSIDEKSQSNKSKYLSSNFYSASPTPLNND